MSCLVRCPLGDVNSTTTAFSGFAGVLAMPSLNHPPGSRTFYSAALPRFSIECRNINHTFCDGFYEIPLHLISNLT